ncbi:MAG: hypothetical protein IJ745_05325 [Bacteroidales bacterium]|nr:hypothetical protein [Bacteroidales bacterium]
MAKINKFISKSGHNWNFSTVGGVTRVNIETGADVAHLHELDQKLWTVLSCPVSGLEFDEKTLTLLDADKDGRIRVNEVVAASQWLTKVLRDMDYLLDGKDAIDFAQVKDDTDEGKQVLDSARLILKQLGQDKESITLADVAEYMAGYEEKCKAEYTAANAEPYEPPFGDKSDDAEAAVNALRAKVADYFMRCKLVQFDEDASGVLDVQVDKIAAISGNNLADSAAEISGYPLARPVKEALLPLTGGINPAWQAAFATLKSLVLDVDFAGKESIGEEEWNAVLAKVDAYAAWKAAGQTAMDETVAEQLKVHGAAIEPVEKLLRLCRDFFTLLRNFVVFKDFYNRAPGTEAVFQAGRLFIDQRCCDLCVKVTDMPKHLASAGKSGLYLLYCHCVSKTKGQEMDIVAALTDGDIKDLHEGKNAVFYDRTGTDWDATVTKIIDNPISIRQAFWSPYRKFGQWITDKITKNAQEKEAKQFENMTAKADETTTNLAAKQEGAAADAAAADGKKAQMFDIAKFAGIFAAIGLALGAIGAALATLGGFVTAKWYNIILLVAAIVIFISGPSMLLAWLKLRKRNLGPLLNANGWAINSVVKINTTFGATLTSMAKFPKVVGKDPLADKKMAWWKKCLIWLVILAALFVIGFRLVEHRWVWEPKPVEAVEAVDAVDEEDNIVLAEPSDTAADPAEDAAQE